MFSARDREQGKGRIVLGHQKRSNHGSKQVNQGAGTEKEQPASDQHVMWTKSKQAGKLISKSGLFNWTKEDTRLELTAACGFFYNWSLLSGQYHLPCVLCINELIQYGLRRIAIPYNFNSKRLRCKNLMFDLRTIRQSWQSHHSWGEVGSVGVSD